MSQVVFKGPAGATFQAWKVRSGTWVAKGQILALTQEPVVDGTPTMGKVRAEQAGKISELCVKSGHELTIGLVLAQLSSDCPHATLMKDMCADCGADLRLLEESEPGHAQNKSQAAVAMVHSIPELKVSSKEAESLGQEDEARLLKHRKLVLLVDLDQTLIHTTYETIPKNVKDVYHFQLYGPRSPLHHTRLRPGTQKFLENISQLFELHICTFGARLYAHTIAGFIDPKSKYFSHRILSRDECFDNRSKTANLSSLFPCGDHMVCIIDDREDVWNFASNLVQVKPYVFFKSTGDINAPPGAAPNPKEGSTEAKKPKPAAPTPPNESEVVKPKEDTSMDETSSTAMKPETKGDVKEEGELDKDKKDEVDPPKEKTEEELVEMDDNDDYLVYLEDILSTIHKAYYDMYDQRNAKKEEQTKTDPKGKLNLKFVIPYVKRKILQGTNILFSGVVPTHIPLQKSKAYRIARTLGANVLDTVTPESNITHLIAARIGTAKVNDVRKMKGVHIVTPDWLWCCAERWEKVDERMFPLNKASQVTLKPPVHCSGGGPDQDLDALESENLPEISNPFLAMSKNDLQGMDDEVNDVLSEDNDDSSSSESEPTPDGDDDSKLGGEIQYDSENEEVGMHCDDGRRSGKKRKHADVDDDDGDEGSTSSGESDEASNDEDELQGMANELEKEFFDQEED
ncbi:hypothetical protein TCAL_07221 [Tigriopus californicus]|uniref:RNA polymerase II subunit A C-terminal domain phosphatase n=1 Tax=Tigriopus californicus TaxID=6832 RepID=A0A553NQZ4_TIGCA|nr:RNA polymerase II subunit A C-terminal domain phosphatase-like [Tigriopus californicus]TRY67809.1 hypothetical protein TCAL_07221 [Tigriopus californicus]|eukprot:TCALIF_07221-PA protein Name:"Similar to Ctdp1 RNA polymerase II subunit A C-terminal domain phosphatase (Mus musculus)" AED:0.05 eAED:0.05 QI:219/1/1/1/0.8/0.66/6/726/684